MTVQGSCMPSTTYPLVHLFFKLYCRNVMIVLAYATITSTPKIRHVIFLICGICSKIDKNVITNNCMIILLYTK